MSISLKTSRIRGALSKKDNHLSSAISEGHNSEDTQDSEPVALGLRIQQVVVLKYYRSAIPRGNNAKYTQVIVTVYVQENVQDH